LIEYFHEEVDRLQICQLIVIRIYTRAKEQPGISPVYDLAATAELDEVGLVLLVARSNESVDFALEFDLFVVIVRAIPFG